MLLAGQIRRWSLVALPAYTDRDLQQREQDNMRQAVSTLVEWGGQLAEASGNSHFKFGASESFHGIFSQFKSTTSRYGQHGSVCRHKQRQQASLPFIAFSGSNNGMEIRPCGNICGSNFKNFSDIPKTVIDFKYKLEIRISSSQKPTQLMEVPSNVHHWPVTTTMDSYLLLLASYLLH